MEESMGTLTDDMKRVVGEQKLGYIATVCPDGTPNLSPKGTTTVWDDDHLVFAHICSPNTVANLLHNPGIEVNVVDVVTRKGYRFKGTGEVLTEEPLFNQLMGLYRDEDAEARLRDADRRVQALVLVKVDRALPLISPAYDAGATEEEIARHWERYWETLWNSRGSRTT
jgi:uncharacterized protein